MKLLSFLENFYLFKKFPNLYQFIQFGIVGTIGAIVDLGLLNLLVAVGKLDVYISAIISFTAAVISNFILNKIWTFKGVKTSKSSLYQFFQFMVVSMIGLGINLVVMFIFIEWAGLWYNWAKIIAILVVYIWNYIINKMWTFKAKNEDISTLPDN